MREVWGRVEADQIQNYLYKHMDVALSAGLS